MWPRRSVRLESWLSSWIRRGGVPVLTMRDPGHNDNGWRHQMAFGAGPAGVYVTNPVECVPASELAEQLSAPSELLVRAGKIWDFREAFFSTPSKPLAHTKKPHKSFSVHSPFLHVSDRDSFFFCRFAGVLDTDMILMRVYLNFEFDGGFSSLGSMLNINISPTGHFGCLKFQLDIRFWRISIFTTKPEYAEAKHDEENLLSVSHKPKTSCINLFHPCYLNDWKTFIALKKIMDLKIKSSFNR